MPFQRLMERLVDYAANRYRSDTERNSPGIDWIATTARVTECQVYYGARTGRIPAPGIPMPGHIVKFSYEADGRSFNGKFRSSIPFNVGDEFKLSCDPDHPNKNTANQRRWPQIVAVWCLAILTVWFAAWWKNR